MLHCVCLSQDLDPVEREQRVCEHEGVGSWRKQTGENGDYLLISRTYSSVKFLSSVLKRSEPLICISRELAALENHELRHQWEWERSRKGGQNCLLHVLRVYFKCVYLKAVESSRARGRSGVLKCVSNTDEACLGSVPNLGVGSQRLQSYQLNID